MKQFLLLVACLCAGFTATHAQTVYVDAGATGLNDGSTWANAFTDLTVALDSAATGDAIWIAQGRYVTPDSSSFVIDRELSLYGGFAGGETSLDEADPTANETILSGDVMNNDSVGVYDSLLMSDNNRVLLILDTAAAVSSYTATLDGLTIRDGVIAENFVAGGLVPFAGGGIYSDARVNLSRITFTANRASFGSATCLIFSTSSGSTYDSITTRGNYAGIQPAHYLRLTDSVSITNSVFDGESEADNSGMVYSQDGGNLTIDNCEFLDITPATGNGGAIFGDESQNLRITNSSFRNCSSGFGGAILLFGDAVANDSTTVINNCEFTENTAARTGGAIYIQDERFEISNSTFANNSGTTGTIGMFGSGDGDTYSITNCTFTGNGGNDSPYFRGAGVYMALTSGATADSIVIDSCTFNGNITTQEDGIVSGGALFISGAAGGRPYVGVRNSSFTSNSSLEGADGAGMYLVDGAIVDIADSDFSNNAASGTGGVFFSLQFTEEVIDTTSGDTVIFDLYPEDNIPELRITRSLFLNNSAASQGGVADMQIGQVTMTNSIAIGNTVSVGEGSGGAFIINGTDNAPAILENVFVNNTFYNNSDGGREGRDTLLGAAGNAIALFQPGGTNADSNSVTLTIQNNAFFQVGEDEESLGIEQTGDDGEIVINSLGGNYFNSNAQPNFPTTLVNGVEDITDLDVIDTDIFSDPFGDRTDFPEVDLVNEDTNPLVDGGTTGPLVPELDFFRETRDSMPDIGAIEFRDMRVDVAEPIANSGFAFKFFPNPTSNFLNITNEDASVTRFTVLVSDMQGRFLAGRQLGSGNNRLDLTALPKGVYNLSLLINGKTYSQQVVKQ